MTQTIEAFFTAGVLKPLEVLPLHEQQRVRVTVETIESEPTDRRKAALHRLIDRLERSTLSLGGRCLHERNSTNVIVTFDTNVLVYAADRRDLAKQAKAIELLRGPDEAVLLWQVACEC